MMNVFLLYLKHFKLRCDVRPPDGGSTWPQQPQPRPRPGFVTWVTWDEVGQTWGPSFGLLGGLLAPVEDFLALGLRHCYYHHCRIRRNHFVAGFHFAFCPWDKWCTGYKSLCTALELSPTPTGVSSTLEWLSPSVIKRSQRCGNFLKENLKFAKLSFLDFAKKFVKLKGDVHCFARM